MDLVVNKVEQQPTAATVQNLLQAGDTANTFANSSRTLVIIRGEAVVSPDCVVEVPIETATVQVDTFGQVPLTKITITIAANEVWAFVAPIGAHGSKPNLNITAGNADEIEVEVYQLPLGL